MPCDAGPSKENIEDQDTMARLACMYCTFLDDQGEPIPDWAEDWWKRHQEYDRVRAESEAIQLANKRLRDLALAKLTPEERKTLGL